MKVKTAEQDVAQIRKEKPTFDKQTTLAETRAAKTESSKNIDNFFVAKHFKSEKCDSPSVSSLPQPAVPALYEKRELWPGRSQLQEVLPGLLISNFFGARDVKRLTSSAISHIVVCADELPIFFPDKFIHLKLDGLTDNTGTSLNAHINAALPWIENAITNGGRVLLHCASGSSRSGAILIAYLMHEMHLTVDEALKLAQAHRPIICPNPGFYEQLRALE